MEMVIYAILVLAASVIVVVVILTLFYKLLDACHRTPKRPPVSRKFKIAGVIDEKVLVNVHLVDGKVFEKMRCLGYTRDPNAGFVFREESDAAGGEDVPSELSDLIILEDAGGVRLLFRTRLVRMIEIPPA